MRAENRGMLWLVGGFAFCPCHLPLTLWLLASVLAGTTAGALLTNHAVVTGAFVTLLWILATWRGVWRLRTAPAYEIKRPSASE